MCQIVNNVYDNTKSETNFYILKKIVLITQNLEACFTN